MKSHDPRLTSDQYQMAKTLWGNRGRYKGQKISNDGSTTCDICDSELADYHLEALKSESSVSVCKLCWPIEYK